MPTPARRILKMNDGSLPQIYVYGYIDGEMAAAFAKEIAWLRSIGHKEFDLHINSRGGDVLDGIAMRTCMRTCGMKINGYVDGLAASMATVIFFTCHMLFMNKFARLMMHKPMGGAFGTAEQIQTTLNFIVDLEADMEMVYVERTGMTAEKVRADFLNGKDNFYTASQAEAAKLIDGTFDGVEVDMPEGDDNDFEMLYNLVSAKMELKFSTDMNEITLQITADLAKMLGVTASADGPAITAAIKKLNGKALQADTYKQQLDEFKEKLVTNEVTAMLDSAQAAKKITPQQHTVFAKQFADNPEDLKEVLDTMASFTSVTSKLNVQERQVGQHTPQVTALMGKGWDTLMKSGEMAQLKKLSADAYGDMFEAKYGRRPE